MSYNQYVGIPFAIQGRDKETGLDCWGLVRTVLQEQYGTILPDLSEEYMGKHPDEIATYIATETPLIATEKLQSPEEGCIVLMKILGFPSHVGVYIGDGYVLHSDPVGKGLSRIERLSRLAHRVEGYYRVK